MKNVHEERRRIIVWTSHYREEEEEKDEERKKKTYKTKWYLIEFKTYNSADKSKFMQV